MKAVQQGSNRLDKTLASELFTEKDALSDSIRTRLQKSPLFDRDGKEQVLDAKELEEATRYWTATITPYLDELKTASVVHTEKLVQTTETSCAAREWKLKDETDAYRVMYREGPEGTLFHTLCLDGIVNGDFTTALCVAWESPLFKEWWPQFHVPTFKITESNWLRRIRVGEDLSMLRFKLPWPMAPREVVISAFELEFFEEELLLCVIESVPEDVELKEKLHGFSNADLPPPSSCVRMVVNGGFVMQRLSESQFFFRTIVNMDMKLDFVPPTFINFMSRQVAGQGLKLYQKAVLAAGNNTGQGKQFQEALKKGPLYRKVKVGLESKPVVREESLQTSRQGEKPGPALKETVKTRTLPGSLRRMGSSDSTNRIVPLPMNADHGNLDDLKNQMVDPVASCVQHPPDQVHGRGAVGKGGSPLKGKSDVADAVAPVKGRSAVADAGAPVKGKSDVSDAVTPATDESHSQRNRGRAYDDPEVEWALNTLNKMIRFTRSKVVETADSQESHPAEREGTRLPGKGPNSETFLTEKQSCDLPLAERLSYLDDKLDVEEICMSTQEQPLSGAIEISTSSSLWSKSENENTSSQDESGTETGSCGSFGRVTSQINADELKRDVAQSNKKKWRWRLFSSRAPGKELRVEQQRPNPPAFFGKE